MRDLIFPWLVKENSKSDDRSSGLDEFEGSGSNEFNGGRKCGLIENFDNFRFDSLVEVLSKEISLSGIVSSFVSEEQLNSASRRKDGTTTSTKIDSFAFVFRLDF